MSKCLKVSGKSFAGFAKKISSSAPSATLISKRSAQISCITLLSRISMLAFAFLPTFKTVRPKSLLHLSIAISFSPSPIVFTSSRALHTIGKRAAKSSSYAKSSLLEHTSAMRQFPSALRMFGILLTGKNVHNSLLRRGIPNCLMRVMASISFPRSSRSLVLRA